MSSFRWNGGGDFKGRKWDTDLPTDSSVSFQGHLHPTASSCLDFGIGFGGSSKEVFEEHEKIRNWSFAALLLDN